MTRLAAAALAAATFCLPASAEIVKVEASGDVAATAAALRAAVEGAGATVFAQVDHAGGAASVGMELAPAQLLVFGNPRLGTPAMQADPLAGLRLPLRVLVYRDAAGTTWLAYDDPADMLSDLAVPADAEYVKTMTGALANLTAAVADG